MVRVGSEVERARVSVNWHDFFVWAVDVVLPVAVVGVCCVCGGSCDITPLPTRAEVVSRDKLSMAVALCSRVWLHPLQLLVADVCTSAAKREPNRCCTRRRLLSAVSPSGCATSVCVPGDGGCGGVGLQMSPVNVASLSRQTSMVRLVHSLPSINFWHSIVTRWLFSR